jgi:hypothetical protein
MPSTNLEHAAFRRGAEKKGNGWGSFRVNLFDEMAVFDSLPSEVRSFVAQFEAKLCLRLLRSRYQNFAKTGRPLDVFFKKERARYNRLTARLYPIPGDET